MRVTGGVFGGRALATPADNRVRPTSDKVRQAIFNILTHKNLGPGFSLEGARVADVFAGTGALGIEALSHGADYCLFVDESAESRALVRTNVERFGLTGRTKIWRRDATSVGPLAAGAGGPFTLVFLDPPYRKKLVDASLESLRAGGWLAPGAVIVAEMAEEDAVTAQGFTLLDDRSYGDTRVVILRHDG